MPPDPNPYAPPAAALDPLSPSGPIVDEGIPLGWRLAGGAFLLNALRNLVVQILVAGPGLFFVGLDVVLGVMLLARKTRWRKFAIARLVLAGILLPGLALGQGNLALAGLELALS